MSELTGAGRLIPASELEFSRYAKNLAWLLECPLHFAREALSICYGFGSEHELRQAIPAPGDKEASTGPFEPPRARPAFAPVDEEPKSSPPAPNELQSFSPREDRLITISLNCMYQREYKLTREQALNLRGRLRRRHYAILDGAFFSAPSVHRKAFAEVKKGIIAMEGSPDDAERYLEQNWPPGFWTYLECMPTRDFDPTPALEELKDKSIYFSPEEILGLANISKETAVHRAAAVFLAMAGTGGEGHSLPETTAFFDGPPEPEVRIGHTGLFYSSWMGDWEQELEQSIAALRIPAKVEKKLKEKFIPEEILKDPPTGTPDELLMLARGWRLKELRAYCSAYIESEYGEKRWSLRGESFWPGTPGYTVTEPSPLVLQFSRAAASLMVTIELTEESQYHSLGENFRALKFKALLTRAAPDEVEDVVGYMAGWTLQMDDGEYAANAVDVLEYIGDPMLHDGLDGFVKGYLPFTGQSELEFNNSQFSNGVCITELVLREKYRNQGLSSIALEGFANTISNAMYCETPEHWETMADFERPTDDAADYMDRMDDDPYPSTPGVFLIPVDRKNKKLRKHLLGLEITVESLDEGVDVFPFQPSVESAPDET